MLKDLQLDHSVLIDQLEFMKHNLVEDMQGSSLK